MPPSTSVATHEPAHCGVVAETISRFGGDARLGIKESEVEHRRAQYGVNALTESSPPPLWRQLLAQLQEIVVGLLLLAAVIAAALGEWVDTGAILAIVLMNAGLGVFQQRKAEKALSSLQKLSAPTAKVVRDGRLRAIAVRELVPGDRIEVEAGDHVPADARLIDGFGLQSLEAALTGESTPTAKDPTAVLCLETPVGDRRNMIFQGSVISSGKASAVVVATGMNTQLGRIAELLAEQKTEPTPLQRRLAALGRGLVLLCVALVGVIFALQLARGGEFLETLHLAVSLAVAAIPEGLPAAVTITLAVGLERLVRRQAIVRKLSSVETLGSVNVICSDKTGTLTRNEMTVREVHTAGESYAVSGAGYGPQGEFKSARLARDVVPAQQPDLLRVLEAAAWCNHARVAPAPEGKDRWQVIGDPTEGALIVLARKAGLESDNRGTLLYEIPFDSDRKAMSVVVAPPGRNPVMYLKGAPEVVLEKCVSLQRNGQTVSMTDDDRAALLAVADEMAGRALRVLAFAMRHDVELEIGIEVENNMVFAGFVGMIDPPRDEARVAVAHCRSAGIRPIMITGDHPSTALAIAKELGIASEGQAAITGRELDPLTDASLVARLPNVAVFARVTAEHKLRLVRLLRAQGNVVAMTGDGVNDAPAVKAADIGIAMGITGTDVTKEASTMVLADDNFATIVNAVEEGRGIFDNIQKFIHYLLAGNAGKIIFMFVAALLGWPIPVLAVQLLWLNLVTDGLPALGLGMERPEPGIMSRKPRPGSAPLIGWSQGLLLLCHGLISATAALAGFWFVYEGKDENLADARVVAFCILAFSQLGYAMTCRSWRTPFLALGIGSNPSLLSAIGVSFALQIGIVLIPFLHPIFNIDAYPTMEEWLIIFGLSCLPMLLVELSKLVWSRGSVATEPNERAIHSATAS